VQFLIHVLFLETETRFRFQCLVFGNGNVIPFPGTLLETKASACHLSGAGSGEMALLNQSTPLLHYMPTENGNIVLFLGIDCAVVIHVLFLETETRSHFQDLVFGNGYLFPFPVTILKTETCFRFHFKGNYSFTISCSLILLVHFSVIHVM
jgi:hypothetical protein